MMNAKLIISNQILEEEIFQTILEHSSYYEEK